MAERKTPEQQIEALEKKMEQLKDVYKRQIWYFPTFTYHPVSYTHLDVYKRQPTTIPPYRYSATICRFRTRYKSFPQSQTTPL